MKQTINFYEFKEAFRRYGRADQFSHEALDLIFDYYEDIEEQTGEEMELDVVGICCDLSEDTIEDIAESYSIEADSEGDLKDAVIDHLTYHTIIVGETSSGALVYYQF